MASKNNYFKNKNILISGGNRGIGLEIAKHFYKLGANIILFARNKKKLKKISNILKSKKNQKVIIENCDISKVKEIDNLFNKITKKVKKIDILINNAGIYGPKGKFEDLPWKDIEETFNINLFGSIYLIKCIIPHFKKFNKGKIIQLSGGGAASPLPFFSAYATSKAGVVRFVENLSEELISYKIDINAIAPGPVNTGMLEEVLKENPKKVGKSFYNKSLAQKKSGGTDIKKILNCIEFLSHKKSNGISGKLISVLWDNWKNYSKYKEILKKTDLGNLRRITGRDRSYKFFDKND